MQKTFSYSAIWLKFLIIMFAINTSMAHGACCIDIDKPQAPLEMSAPCHGTSADTNNTDNDPQQNGCLSCMATTLPLEPFIQALTAKHNIAPFTLKSFTSKPIADLFKPPIQRLS